MGRCMSPCLGDLDPNAYRGQLDEALALFEGPGRRRGPAGRASSADAGRPPQTRRYERAAALLRRRERLAWLLARLEGDAAGDARGPRLVLAAPPRQGALRRLLDRRAAGWPTGAPLPAPERARERTAAVAGPPRRRAARPRCRPTRWTRSGSCTAGWPSTSRPRWRSIPPPEPETLLDWLRSSGAATGRRRPPRCRPPSPPRTRPRRARRPRSRSSSGCRRRTAWWWSRRSGRAPAACRRPAARTRCRRRRSAVIGPVIL